MFESRRSKQIRQKQQWLIRKAEIHIKLVGLRYEMSEWDSKRMAVFASVKNITFPTTIAKEIGELEAEQDLINLALIKIEMEIKHTI